MLRFIFPVIAALIALSGNPVPPADPVFTDVDVYIIAGQSNAVGRADTTNLSATLRAVQPNVQIFQTTTQIFQSMKAGVNVGANAGQFGPEVNLGYKLQEYKGKKVYIIKYAVGATTLAVRGGTDWNTTSANDLYANLTNYINQAHLTLRSMYLNPKYRAFIWMQGEEDATNQTYADAYLTNLQALAAGIRAHPRISNSSLKMVIGRINGASDPSEVYRSTVRQAQADFVAADVNANLIDCDSYPLKDVVHYNEVGQVSFGLDIFNIVKDITL